MREGRRVSARTEQQAAHLWLGFLKQRAAIAILNHFLAWNFAPDLATVVNWTCMHVPVAARVLRARKRCALSLQPCATL